MLILYWVKLTLVLQSMQSKSKNCHTAQVRKAAQEAVRVVLKGSQFITTENAPPYHPAASATAKYCIQQIEQCGGELSNTVFLSSNANDIIKFCNVGTKINFVVQHQQGCHGTGH